ncbi:MAG: hypothetical protein A2660_01575 [Candidatus Doudnabacteria bacterium RIFCSPHIGHO2_01_FULL_45_18]|uniref:Uncharacterized protein n=1 Tax=Candidatus Doudnabacteria bacterium RIFCSPHIGHO2_01_FULL_45_18 TaxID=1817823 RepID=A0A1F5NQU5_9BACT|nr:MAG: hypothetical protein A2660_01575 [Candidatus Doudnabacteria bacterium RIFCSPHIGHO2_01_FULL_45_18]
MTEKYEPGLNEIKDAEESMYISQQARSEARENAFNVLNPEQKEKLLKSKLEIEKENGDAIRVMGTVELEGRPASLEVFFDNKGAYLAKVDGETVEDAKRAKELYEFYLPIAEVLKQDKYFPTEESDIVRRSKEHNELMGRSK